MKLKTVLVRLTTACVTVGVVTVSAVASSLAGTLNYTGTTVSGATWNRPVSGNPPTPPTSGVGTNVAYSVQEFNVDTTGFYNFQSTATSPVEWDNYLFLYQTSFDPTTPFTNVIIGNDDNPSIGLAGFNNISLTAGLNYFLVTSGFGNSDQGEFSNNINGLGNITIGSASVPEPASVMGILGLGAFGVTSLRKRKQTAAVKA
ncbi:PEP-CTERM sorting domain-containing protein [Anabaena cylindrica FACHB-243]|uniref:PEP motif putative anchor domain protein n=1 Tax=Anabaena cylindrica (strain ATCC 27899 / PCC 7122) TaxID=272123 RepID=K9ZCD6_ANACC|nr:MULTISPECIES: PEP-CTERM sorting domain-containing protein [Anabaena]AFZ56888.1 PEP motif putative anchor domain protein [Anabaena cylindrica PCC 7122]MBD2421229.1 PEP-CTERM sorting domain-containing protein [Anabaena cylindrica FACHB-243]MBY5284998.1 PEP-CTERM sorting domain-containing protein [Anabaena sp. CCAP 1446/1C]MBY5311263.1 PEP-CTERM sorting domain-containing protein [Anabaena sp. CCAP 1446/1C]MCM2408932.1 PEP-CTERM sorting domain-containing protein [Anabaena sp. CCAP 1446/1C]